MAKTHIIMPVKESISTAEESIRAIAAVGESLTVYDDYSTAATAERLDTLSQELGFRVLHIADHIDHPSPNYRWVLQHAQREALADEANLVIVESDVLIEKDTIERLRQGATDGVGMVAAVTHDEQGQINFPYEYARRIDHDGECSKRLSFCCTMLTQELLKAYSFEQLDPQKDWYDVMISHESVALGLKNILQISNPVIHKPHSSRPWKQLKYTNPLLYYWRKITRRYDKI